MTRRKERHEKIIRELQLVSIGFLFGCMAAAVAFAAIMRAK